MVRSHPALPTIEERFEAKVRRTGSCWLWTCPPDRCGYGFFRVGRKKWRAHRVAYELYVGPIPRGLLVLHRCDVPACVNPQHLFLGTDADNGADKKAKGRAPRVIGNAKLTPEAVN